MTYRTTAPASRRCFVRAISVLLGVGALVTPTFAQVPSASNTPQSRAAAREWAQALRRTRRFGVRTKTPNTVSKKRVTASGRRVDREGPLQRALDQVSLTPNERDKIAALGAKADSDGKATYADHHLTLDQYQARMAAIDADYRKGIEDTLTPTQRDKFQRLLTMSESPGRKGK